MDRLLEAADLPSLLAAVAWATGDPALAPADLWLDPARALEPHGGWDEAQLAKARTLATAGIRRCLDGGTGSGPAARDDALTQRLVGWLSGTPTQRNTRQQFVVTGEHAELAPVLAAHDDVAAIWYFGADAGVEEVERLSAGNMKQTWTEPGHARRWRAREQGEGREFLRRATQVKNIWIPYGE